MNFISDNGPLFALLAIILCCLMGKIYNKVYGSGGFPVIALGSFIGVVVSLIIVKFAGFEDATPETIFTICIGILALPINQTIHAILDWQKINQYNMINRKINSLKEELACVQIKANENKIVLSFITLIKNCGGDTKEIEMNEKLKAQNELMRLEYDLKEEINVLSAKI